MKLLFLVASAHAFGAGFGEIAEDWDCSKYDENDKEAYMKEGIDKKHQLQFTTQVLQTIIYSLNIRLAI